MRCPTKTCTRPQAAGCADAAPVFPSVLPSFECVYFFTILHSRADFQWNPFCFAGASPGTWRFHGQKGGENVEVSDKRQDNRANFLRDFYVSFALTAPAAYGILKREALSIRRLPKMMHKEMPFLLCNLPKVSGCNKCPYLCVKECLPGGRNGDKMKGKKAGLS